MSDQNKKLSVVFAASEAVPFMKTGGLGDVAGSLPMALKDAGCDIRVIIPKYGTIPEEYVSQMHHVADFYVSLSWRSIWCGVDELEYKGVTYDFIDNQDYFNRDRPYGYFDDGERFAFFGKALCECLQYLPDFQCDILHCNDWHTALAPVYLREFYRGIPMYDNIKTILTVHNLKFQGQYSAYILGDICGLADIPAAADQLWAGPDAINYMKGGACYADALTTVSPTYAGEIQDPFYGEHLDDVFRRRSGVLSGILNGIDVDEYNPSTDEGIPNTYSRKDLAGKAADKAALQEEMGLAVDPLRPLVIMIGRLTKQKGLDLVNYALDDLVSASLQFAILGTGDKNFEDALSYFAWKYPGAVATRITFDSALSHRMYAGADMLLMPSLFEPCGLSQMIAMRYGTLPIVRETGGLKDSVIPYNQFTGEGTGFSFANFNASEMKDTLLGACDVFWNDHDGWNGIVDNAMATDFSWRVAAGKYIDIYRGLHPEIEFKTTFESEAEKAEKAKAEAEAKAAEAKAAAEKKAAEAKAAAEKLRKAAEAKKAEEEKKAAEVKAAAEKKAAEAKAAAEKKAAEAKAEAEKLRKAAEAKKAEEEKKAAEVKAAAEKKAAEAKAAAEKIATEAKAAADKKAAEAKKALETAAKPAAPAKVEKAKVPAKAEKAAAPAKVEKAKAPAKATKAAAPAKTTVAKKPVAAPKPAPKKPTSASEAKSTPKNGTKVEGLGKKGKSHK